MEHVNKAFERLVRRYGAKNAADIKDLILCHYDGEVEACQICGKFFPAGDITDTCQKCDDKHELDFTEVDHREWLRKR